MFILSFQVFMRMNRKAARQENSIFDPQAARNGGSVPDLPTDIRRAWTTQ